MPAREQRHELVEQRSRFLAVVAPAASEDEAAALVQRLRAEFPDATHHCWAYVIGPPGSSARIGLSDDGEPHGSAGRPMLDVLLHGPLGDVAAVVVRWFGGTKLGRGGLVRAYGGVLAEALERTPRAERVDWVALRLELAYADVRAARHVYAPHEVELLGEDFGAAVTHRVRLPAERRDGFLRALADASGGRVVALDD